MNQSRDFRRILLIRRKALGDALVTMRAVTEVARAWPTASIDLVIDRPFVPLLEGLSGNRATAPKIELVAWPPPPGQPWLKWLRAGGHDLVIDWLGSPRTAVWTMLTGAPVRVGYDLPRRRWAYNVKVPRNRSGGYQLRGFAGEAFLDPLRCLGIEPRPWRDGFAAGGLDDVLQESFSAEFNSWLPAWESSGGAKVVMMMSATWSTKGWPAESAARLYEDLRADGYHPLIATGPGDQLLEARLRDLLPVEALAPPTSLLELAWLLSRAQVFVGTDCGPRHLAASFGVPTVTLFGPTDPVGWNPGSPAHVSVRMDVDCSPCDLTECPVPGHPCMTGLTPEMVMAAVRRVLNGPSNGRDKI